MLEAACTCADGITEVNKRDAIISTTVIVCKNLFFDNIEIPPFWRVRIPAGIWNERSIAVNQKPQNLWWIQYNMET